MADEFTELANSLRAFKNGLHDAQMLFGIKQTNKFLALVKPRTPVDTGALRNFWEAKPIEKDGGLYLHIKNDRDYATHVEYGHRVVSHGKEAGYVEGRYMITISLIDLELSAEQDYMKEIDDLLRRCGLDE